MPLSKSRNRTSNSKASAGSIFERDSPTKKFGKKQWVKIYGPPKGKRPVFDSSPTKGDTTTTKRLKYDTNLLDEVPAVLKGDIKRDTRTARSDNSSEDEFLIDFSALSSPERNSSNAPRTAEPILELEIEPGAEFGSPDQVEKVPSKIEDDESEDTLNDIILKIANDGLLATLHLSDAEQIEKVRQKYVKYQLSVPTVLKSELKKNTERQLPLIKRILHGKHKVSIFYEMAKQKQAASEHQTITSVEKLDIDWRRFCGGYYGFKRQYYIASVIENALRNTLRNSESRNRTIEYWTIPSFTAYVLANEVIIRLVMKDMDYKYDDAEALVLETSEYGYVVSDSIELEDDLDTEQANAQEDSQLITTATSFGNSTTGSLLEELYNSD